MYGGLSPTFRDLLDLDVPNKRGINTQTNTIGKGKGQPKKRKEKLTKLEMKKKLEIRKEKNKIFAKLSRDRTKAYYANLEKENERLSMSIQGLEKENERLSMSMQNLHSNFGDLQNELRYVYALACFFIGYQQYLYK